MNIKARVQGNIENGNYTHATMAEYLGISVPTLYTRLARENWKKGEISLIMRLK